MIFSIWSVSAADSTTRDQMASAQNAAKFLKINFYSLHPTAADSCCSGCSFVAFDSNFLCVTTTLEAAESAAVREAPSSVSQILYYRFNTQGH